MRRTIQFFEWDSARWVKRGAEGMNSGDDLRLISGRKAYAAKQAQIRWDMVEAAKAAFLDLRDRLDAQTTGASGAK